MIEPVSKSSSEREESMQRIPINDPRAVALTSAIRGGDVAALEAQLSTDPTLARARIVDASGTARTLLHVVADWPGHFPNGGATVAALIAAGAEVDAPVEHGNPKGTPETPLHWAASSDDVAVLDALLDGGANIEATGAVFTGGTPMSDAVIFAQWNAARRLLERGAKTTFWQAAALGQLDAVRAYVTATPPPSPEDITNALWNASRGGHLAVAQYLCDQGAQVDWVGHDHKTPLDVARESGVPDLIAWLEARLARG